MGKKIVAALIVILVSFIYFIYGIQYVTCDSYVFQYEKFGHKLIVANGINHIGEEIAINEEEIQLDSESIKYLYQKQQNGENDHFYFEEADGAKKEMTGVSEKNVSFGSTNDTSYSGTSSDGSANDDIAFYSSIVMSYIVLQRLMVKLQIYGVIELLLIIAAIWLYVNKEKILENKEKQVSLKYERLMNWSLVIPVIGAWLIHLLK